MDFWRRWILGARAARLARAARGVGDPAALFDLVRRGRTFRATQIRSEFLRLLGLVRDLRPARLLEIGTGRGGTTFLFSRVSAPGSVLVTVDLAMPAPFRLALPRLAPPGGRIAALEGDSHAEATAAAVREALGAPADFLFLDGDHTFEGVRRDFEAFSPLVRPGGLVAFHDIVPDHAQRGDTPTGRSTGGVPRFWAGLRAARPEACEEIVEDPAQDGFGIGVLRV